MDTQKYTLESLRQDIIDNNLHVKAIIQVNGLFKKKKIKNIISLMTFLQNIFIVLAK